MRCYYQHTLSQNPLRRIGRQDITSHVDFTAVDHTLMVNRIKRVGKLSQRQFLLNLGLKDFSDDITLRSLTNEFSREDSQENLAGIEALIDGDWLGKFKVLADKKKHVYDEDIVALVDDSLIKDDNVISLKSLKVFAGTGEPQRAEMTLEVYGLSLIHI